MRKVILHYHLFKNAGTSLDAAFKENFSEEKGEWVTKEFPNQPAANREQVRQWILDNPQAKCFSSHTALFPVPEFDDIQVFPVIFVRHPIDRIASAYAFERKQNGSTFGSVLARNTSLKGYIETRLALPHDRQCRNFHVSRFSSGTTNSEISELEKALKEADKLPFVGLVENFDRSIEKLNSVLSDCWADGNYLSVKKQNVSSRKKGSLEEKLSSIRDELGEVFFNELMLLNEDDIALLNFCADKY
ncbi:sulfotransferase family 2 domain-containing protein [Alteromonas macleodii]|uniref:sulfotransferase family 2 domain-containing protein n=1 Tax=Alteromonas macleodii TaxID=28108 RepID=UPI00313A7710